MLPDETANLDIDIRHRRAWRGSSLVRIGVLQPQVLGRRWRLASGARADCTRTVAIGDSDQVSSVGGTSFGSKGWGEGRWAVIGGNPETAPATEICVAVSGDSGDKG
jgi:hypothetical protein